MKEDYTIEQLEKTFREHSEQYEIDEKERFDKMLAQAIQINGQIPIEQHFNISEALHVICREINQLKSLTAGRRYEILGKLPID